MAVVLPLRFSNVLLEPLLVLFTLPFIGFTLGRGVELINALLLLFAGHPTFVYFVCFVVPSIRLVAP